MTGMAKLDENEKEPDSGSSPRLIPSAVAEHRRRIAMIPRCPCHSWTRQARSPKTDAWRLVMTTEPLPPGGPEPGQWFLNPDPMRLAGRSMSRDMS